MKQTAVVICPGRGTYNREELGYWGRYHADKKAFIAAIDHYRQGLGQPSIEALDGSASYSLNRHGVGENASALIYACALGDFADIDRDRYDIVAVTGNSMGWYLALAAAQALDAETAIKVVNSMGSMMQEGVIGGQLVYPVVDEAWRPVPAMREQLLQQVAAVNQLADCEAYLSIDLGGLMVIGANQSALNELKSRLPPVDGRYPLMLAKHAAFHTPLLASVSSRAKSMLSSKLFTRPALPLIDGRGHIWQPFATDIHALYDYTLGHQVVAPYNFSSVIEVAIKEFAPDKLILLGPGSTLGAPIGQALIKHNWLGLSNKPLFKQRQSDDPFLLAMGQEEQRSRVVN
ncbi:ACP S-malonyltransferase [Sedimenticola selenatireducens]|uniref:[acyl-carrier-protein] S-malonyltransferase n=1 Tax=Sedimenticola selenatireducens TaxID=191960 RepID=A0A558DSU9_9GAMM|nr:ACP S-malonyltransferase [Sedimenticola selenatireducens]TVO76633.1 ACP S-malonyltransferase [Sedimenticola selenatireducens]TVT64076.1 MAG: ACP S-malonyltransferase [Sedimenticola selenatireducens]